MSGQWTKSYTGSLVVFHELDSAKFGKVCNHTIDMTCLKPCESTFPFRIASISGSMMVKMPSCLGIAARRAAASGACLKSCSNNARVGIPSARTPKQHFGSEGYAHPVELRPKPQVTAGYISPPDNCGLALTAMAKCCIAIGHVRKGIPA